MTDEARQHVEQLREPLGKAAEEGHDQAEDLLGHVDAYLTTEDPSPEHHRTLRQHLSDGVLHFEVSHPSLSATLDRVVNSLTAAGI